MKDLISFLKTPTIEFLCAPEDLNVIPPPIPAKQGVPEWFKRIAPDSTLSRDHFGAHSMNAKRCLPMVDAMTLGYIIPLWGDTNIRTNEDCSLIDASQPPLGKTVEFHSHEQVGGKSGRFGVTPPLKFINRWVIRTAPGYSTLFIPPVNAFDRRFTCCSAMVDTDRYWREINFPAMWHLPNFDEVVEAGTPLVCAIPIKRATVIKKHTVRSLSSNEQSERLRTERVQDSRRHYYTKELRVKK